jgi:hypothetical protein
MPKERSYRNYDDDSADPENTGRRRSSQSHDDEWGDMRQTRHASDREGRSRQDASSRIDSSREGREFDYDRERSEGGRGSAQWRNQGEPRGWQNPESRYEGYGDRERGWRGESRSWSGAQEGRYQQNENRRDRGDSWRGPQGSLRYAPQGNQSRESRDSYELGGNPYGSGGYRESGYGQGGFDQSGREQSGFGQPAYGQSGYGQGGQFGRAYPGYSRQQTGQGGFRSQEGGYESFEGSDYSPSERGFQSYEEGSGRYFDRGTSHSPNRGEPDWLGSERGGQGSWRDQGQGSSMRGDYRGSGGMGQEQGSMRGPHTGKGPKGYKRSDDRVKEEVCDLLERQGDIDASEIEVAIKEGIVTLRGTVPDRSTKRKAEESVSRMYGVTDVMNELRVSGAQQSAESSEKSSAEKSDKSSLSSTSTKENERQRNTTNQTSR